MQEQINGTAGLVTFEPARPPVWQATAIGEYKRSWPIRHTELRAQLGARIMALTGRRISSGEIYTDGQLAVVGVDGETFRLYRYGGLVLVRECAYCGTGHFESPQISSLSDLGCALSAWQPLHEDCEGSLPEDLADF